MWEIKGSQGDISKHSYDRVDYMDFKIYIIIGNKTEIDEFFLKSERGYHYI